MRILAGCIASMMICACSFAQNANHYLSIKPVTKVFVVDNVESANVHLTIATAAGAPAYVLQCHAASYSQDRDFAYSGEFECRLSSVNMADQYSTLFTEDDHQSRDWESRARFFARSLTGACADIPDFGARRSFRLRNMQITLQVSNALLAPDGTLRGLTLRVEVARDVAAKREIAAPVPFPDKAPSECELGRYFPRAAGGVG